MEYLYPILATALTLCVCTYITFCANAAKYRAQKDRAEAFAVKQRALREVAFDAVAYADEQTAKAKKTGSLLIPDKLSLGIEYIRKDYRIPDVEDEEAGEMIESILGKCNGGASGKDKVTP